MTDTGIFYGTGAAEGVPSPFCDCPMCNYAREHGGKDVRKRSCFNHFSSHSAAKSGIPLCALFHQRICHLTDLV